jgi:N-methylhydantoinase B
VTVTELSPARPAVDPVTLEVVRASLLAIVREMSVTLARTSYSTIIREVHDFSCVLFDVQRRLIAQAEGIPVFHGSMDFVVEAVTGRFPLADMRPGDVFITNDPYLGGNTHKPDINIVMPIFWEGELVMLSASKAHFLDIGGKDPGSWSPDARDAFQEGISLPPVRLHDAGRPNQAVEDILFANVRIPYLEQGDLAAQLAAGKTAELRAHELLERYGPELVAAAVEQLLDHGERVTRAAVEAIPDGVYRASGFSDTDGSSDEPIPIAVAVTVRGGDVEIDFAGSAPQRAASSGNSHWVWTVSFCREAIMFLADTSLGANAGSYRPITVSAPEGSVFRPRPPAPVTTGVGEMATRGLELVIQALAQVLPERMIAGTFGSMGCMTLAGESPDGGGPFVHFSPYAGGWGARARADGNSATVSLLSGDNFNIPCEVMETRFPGLLAERYALHEGSAGPGRHRGGFGVIYDYRMLVPGQVSVTIDRTTFPPYGVQGGHPGRSGGLVINPGAPDERRLTMGSGVPLAEGDLVSHRMAGGGGFGHPHDRDPALVAEDVRNGLVDPTEAREAYGVVLRPGTFEVDEAATEAARSAG